jgi:hypothetical protein
MVQALHLPTLLFLSLLTKDLAGVNFIIHSIIVVFVARRPRSRRRMDHGRSIFQTRHYCHKGGLSGSISLSRWKLL